MVKVASIAVLQVNPRFKPALRGAIKESLRQTGMIFAEVAKRLTTDEGHVVTGRYRGSIGNSKTTDGVFMFSQNDTVLDVGTNVPYSEILEGKYSLLARSVDMTAPIAMAKLGVTFSAYLDSNS